MQKEINQRRRWGLCLAFVAFFAACHKNSSSSSSSGTVSGATGDLTNLVLSYSAVTPASISLERVKSSGRLQPKTFNTCTGITFNNISYAPYGTIGNETGCPNPSTDIEVEYSASGSPAETLHISSCTSGGYTFYGQLTLSFGASELICVNSAGSVDSLSGQINLNSSNMEISGNGLTPSTCTINVPLILSDSPGGIPTGTATNASACGQVFSVTAQQ